MSSASKSKAGAARVEVQKSGELRVVAPAKINLFLHITGQREDGYHTLESLFVFTASGDELTLSHADHVGLSVVGPFATTIPDDDSNLVVKAAQILKHRFNVEAGADIRLEKNLPVASGIGGGSSDAAAALVGLNQLWNLGLSDDELADIALELGADVPACIMSKPSLVRGIGEKLEPHDLGWEAGVLLVNPLTALSTAGIFTQYKEFRREHDLPTFDQNLSNPTEACKSISALQAHTANSLAGPAKEACPQIAEVEAFLERDDRADMIRMSGSGATVFALYPSSEIATAVAATIHEQAPHWWVMADRLS